MNPGGPFLSERAKRIFEVLVEDYIATAEPVGSRIIAQKSNLHLSSATIRNILAELEEMGLLMQPHTSAGRVPTDRGFRFYVDNVLDVHDLNDRERQEIKTKYTQHPVEPVDLFRETSKILSLSSHYLGVVWAPRMSAIVLQHLEFVKLKRHAVLAILVTTTGLVHNRVIDVEEDLSQSELDDLSNYINTFVTGLTLHQIREKLVEQMRMVKIHYDRMLDQALKLGERALCSLTDADVFIEGRTNILGEPEFGNAETMVDLFRVFEEKATMVKLLDKCLEPRGVQISIGSESQVQEIEPCSLVTSTYSYKGFVIGALGVIGPRRMKYSRVIPLVDFTARLLTEILEAP